MTYRPKRPTAESLILEALARADDFMALEQLVQATGYGRRHLASALWNLHRFRAVESIVSDGCLWWFATPDTGTRQVIFKERAEELKPRNRRPRKCLDRGP